MNDQQRANLNALLEEAGQPEPNKMRMELLLMSLNMSIICQYEPTSSKDSDGHAMKMPTAVFCNLYFLKFDGSYRPLRDYTKCHAVMMYCFRATQLYSIFYEEKYLRLPGDDEEDTLSSYDSFTSYDNGIDYIADDVELNMDAFEAFVAEEHNSNQGTGNTVNGNNEFANINYIGETGLDLQTQEREEDRVRRMNSQPQQTVMSSSDIINLRITILFTASTR
ncbi:hypothetical protein MBANPS3_008291 [Mucor bainieri]